MLNLAQNGENESVRKAALEALAGLGSENAVQPLLKIAIGNDELAPAARSSLVRLGQGRRIAAALDATDDFDEKIAIAGILSEQGNAAAVAALVDLTKTATENQAETLEKALDGALAATRTGTDAGLVPAMNASNEFGQQILLKMLHHDGSDRALAIVRRHAKEPESDALEVLVKWPNPAPVRDLLAIAMSEESSAATKGFVEMAKLTDEPVTLYVEAFEALPATAQKRMIMSGIGQSASREGLQFAEKQLENDQLREEAAAAAVQIAGRLRGSAREDVERVIGAVVSLDIAKPTRNRAQKVLDRLRKK